MSATTTAPTATSSTGSKGFSLTCIKCGSDTDVIKLDLGDLDTLSCGGCEAEFSLDDVRQVIAEWARLIAWVDAAPRG